MLKNTLDALGRAQCASFSASCLPAVPSRTASVLGRSNAPSERDRATSYCADPLPPSKEDIVAEWSAKERKLTGTVLRPHLVMGPSPELAQ